MSCTESEAYLSIDEFRRARMDPSHAGGVLRGEYCCDTGPVAVQRSERLQVRL